MKRIFLGVALAIALSSIAQAQKVVDSTQIYSWPAATTGTSNAQLGQYLIFTGTTAPRPTTHTIDVSVTGTAPATCTFRVEGSSDASIWYGLDVTSPATTSCTSSYMEHIINKPVRFLRIALTYTQGDNTTKVIFNYAGGRP